MKKIKRKLKYILPVVVGFLYRLGGAEGWSKAWRRYVAPVIAFGLSCWILDSWIPLISILIFAGATSIGYGIHSELYELCNENDFLTRFTVSSLESLAIIPVALLTHSEVLLGLHIATVVGVNTYLGWKNPIHATYEEFLRGFISVWTLIFML